ncbi:flagellin [Alloyangia pacifica]|uniref:flagellin n=1 Tax=Alloyangia pacifica TaxID=311180 RepID=UPI001CFD244F|nr:flagellin [Alloyangia pacifica]
MIYLSKGPSTLYSSLLRRNQNADLSNELSRAEQELSTGYKSDIYKSIGLGASEALALNARLERDEAQSAANSLMLSRLDMMTESMGAMRESVQEALDMAVANSEYSANGVSGVQVAARAALDALIGQAGQSYAGMGLFSGTVNTPNTLQPWETAQSDSSLSPADVFTNLLSGGLNSAADADAVLAELDAIFSDSATDPDTNFESLFYNGSVGNERQRANLGDGVSVAYGVQANDESFRQVLKGLAMLVAQDPADIGDSEAYTTWMGAAVEALSEGMTGLLDAELRVSNVASRLETENEQIADRAVLYKTRLLDLDGVDAYEAASNVTSLQAQLEASYTVTSRLSQLSFLNYM